MRDSKTIFMFMITALLAVSVSMFIAASALAEEGAKKAKHRGIIGALDDMLKGTKEKEGGVMKDVPQPAPGPPPERDIPEPDEQEKVLAELADKLEEEGDFIGEEGEAEQLGSTTDEEGNTTTVYKTKNGVLVKKVTDKNGNVILVERKIATADGGQKVETIDYKAGTKTQATYDRGGRIMSSYTENSSGAKTRAKYKGGVIALSKAIDASGNTTRTTYDDKGRVQYSETKDKTGRVKETTDREDVGGIDTVKHVDNEKGVTTVTATRPDGSKVQETRDNQTGQTLSEVGISADGSLFTYKTGSDADQAFKEAEPISTAKYASTQDWVSGKGSLTAEFRHKDQPELDRQLEAQMAGGKAVSGDDIIVSSLFKERTRASHEEGQEGKPEIAIEHITSSSEVRAVNPDGPYGVRSAGAPVSAEGYGKTPSEALTNALNSAASTVSTHIKGDFLDRMRHTQTTDGGIETQQVGEDITSTLDASSFVVFDDYQVENVGMEDDHYVVKVKAQPGVAVRE